MKFAVKKEIVPLAIVIIMFIAGILAYSRLPERIPIHWNLRGIADGFAGKNPFTALLFPIIALFMWALFLALPIVDPKKEKYAQFTREYGIIRNTLIGFMGFVYALIIVNSTGGTIPIEKAIPFAIGVLFIVLGNLMGKIRQNFFVGFKFPWTLSSEEVWNRTHRLGGKLMVLSGVLTIAGVFFGPLASMILMLSSLGVMVLTTIVYSYRLYKKAGEKAPSQDHQ